MIKKMSSFLISTILIANILGPMAQNIGEIWLSSGRIIYVDDDNTSGIEDGSISYPFNTIQEGIDAASHGYTVYVFNGVYYENVIVSKSLTLEGEDKNTTVIDGNYFSNVIYLRTNSITIRNFTIRNSRLNYSDAGIHTPSNACNNLLIEDNIFYNNQFGIRYINGSNSIIRNNGLLNNYNGLRLDQVSNTLVDSNIFAENRALGIFFGGTLQSNSNNTIVSNIFINNTNESETFAAITVYGNNHTIEKNHISNNGQGICVVNARDIIIRNNTIKSNYKGIYLYIKPYNPYNSVIYHNNFVDNTIQAMDGAIGKNHWFNPELLEGNYWSSYNGLDDGSGNGKHAIAGDGIGDTEIPHPITGSDFYPFIYEYGWKEDVNQPPIANAGLDQTVFEGDIVYFSSSGSYDPDGTIVSYDWDFGDGSPHSNMENPRHIFNYAGNYTVTLTVTDDEGARGFDTCTINVLVVIKPPVADAGLDQTVYVGDTVYFDGSASYATVGAIKSLEWDFDSNVDSDGDGNTTNDVDGTGAYPTHIYNTVGVYEVTLCVTAKVETHETQKVNQDVVFVMDSSGSMNWNDPDNMRIQAAKNYVDKLNPDDRGAVVDFDTEATLIPDGWPIGDHLSTDYNKIKNNLDMVDSEGGTCISKGLNLSNEELRVHGDPENVHIIILLTDAQNTDPDDDELCINESKIALDRGIRIFTIGLTMTPNSTGEQLLIELANITGGMYFPAPNASSLEEIYEEISEIVENVTVQEMSDYDNCLITVLPPIQPPVANAGYEQTVYEGDTVHFDGSASYDPDGTIVSYEWDFGDGSHYGTGVNPTHIYHVPGNYTVTLTVTDDDGATDTDFCIIAVLPRKQPPIADAGLDQIANEGDTVQFDGSGSYDPDGVGGVWIFKTHNPSPTWGCAAVVLNGEIYYMGGIPCYPIVDPSPVFMKYNPNTDSWYTLPDLPAPRAYLGAAAANNKIYAMGGREGNESTDTVFEFDPTTNSWTVKSSMPVSMEAFGIATVKDKIYVIGGKSIWLCNNSLKSVYEYDPAYDSWTAKSDMPTGRSNLACAVLEDKIYAIGGDAYGSADAVEMYDPATETWTVKASLLSARSGLCAEALQGKIYAFGGTGKWGLPTNATEMYDPSSNSWTARPSMIEARVYFGSGAVGNCIYAMGGSYGPLIVAIPNSTEEYCVGDDLVYEWDFDATDGLWWETGAPPDATGPKQTHTYGDNGVFIVTLRVTDVDNLSAIDICNVTVQNLNPIVTIESAIMDVEIGLRVAGRKYNNVSMTLYEEGNVIGQVSIQRLPGSPNEQMAWIPYILNMTKTYSATVAYEPVDPPYIGGNPVWIYVKFRNGSIMKIHHTFNVQQSKKRDSEHWNHIDPWEVDLNAELIGCTFEVKYHVTDPGSDDEILTFTYGSQTKNVTHLNDPPNHDPYPSPEVKPVDIMDTTTLVYEGSGTVNLFIEDDDGGLGTATFSVA